MNGPDLSKSPGGGPALAIMLPFAVRLRIAEYHDRGGPTDADHTRVREFAPVLAERGDVLQFGGKRGDAADLFNRLADALAVMAFLPGGCKVFGEHFDSSKGRMG